MPVTFFDRLEADPEFTKNLGSLVCATSRFEDALDKYVPVADRSKKLTSGALVKKLKKSKYIGETLNFHIVFAINQRNHLIHNLCKRLKGYSEEDLSGEQFKNRVKHLVEEFRFFTNLLEKELDVVSQAPKGLPKRITKRNLPPRFDV
jgi:hypothetical protein